MKSPRWSSCNVLHGSGPARRLWQFSASGTHVAFQAEPDLPPSGVLPASAVAKGWRNLYHRRLNIAWLPADQIFLRVVHLPNSEPAELPAMLELQLEKLSPLPVNQIVWSYEPLPSKNNEQQSVVFVIVPRNRIEAHLSQLEADGYEADRLELPLLHTLASAPPASDGTWLHLAADSGRLLCLLAWWYGGQLQDLSLIQLPDNEQGPRLLTDHLTHLSWSGEVEGWLSNSPTWHVVADPNLIATWEPQLRNWAAAPLEIHPAPSPRELATLAAARNSRNTSTLNLVPPDFTLRSHQQFVDRLWVQSLGALAVVYCLGVAAYFALVSYHEHQLRSLQQQVVQLAGSYTNALNLKERLRVFQEQVGLKYAALDCWRVTSELLPPEITLESFNFQGGSKIFLAGQVPIEHQEKATEFNAELRKARLHGRPIFDEQNFEAPKFTPRGNNAYRWDFTANLKVEWLE